MCSLKPKINHIHTNFGISESCICGQILSWLRLKLYENVKKAVKRVSMVIFKEQKYLGKSFAIKMKYSKFTVGMSNYGINCMDVFTHKRIDFELKKFIDNQV